MKLLILGAAIFLASLAVSTAAFAEGDDAKKSDLCSGPHCRDGFFFRAAAGPLLYYERELSTYDSTEGEPSSQRLERSWAMGAEVDLSLGATVVPWLAVSGFVQLNLSSARRERLFGGNDRDGGHALFSAIVGPDITFYPLPEGGLHVGARMGLAVFDGLGRSVGIGFGPHVGYAFWVAPELTFGVAGQLTAIYSPSSEEADHGSYSYTTWSIAPALLATFAYN